MTRNRTVIAQICQPLATAMAVLLALTLTTMFLSIGIQVVARSLFSTSVLWLEDLLMPCFIIAIFSGISLAFRNRSHLATRLIPDMLPSPAARLYGKIIDAITIAAMAGFGWQGIEFTQNAFGQFTPVLRLPMGWVYLIIPVSAAISILFILEIQSADMDASQ